METDGITNILVQLKKEDETKRFETLRMILDYYYQSSMVKYKELIYEEYNRLSKEIDKAVLDEKKN